LLAFGPTREYVAAGIYHKETEGKLATYEGFSDAKAELKAHFDAVVPPLLVSLSLSFSSKGQPVRFLHRKAAALGETVDGRKIIDWRAEGSGGAFVSGGAVPEARVVALSASACEKAKTIHRKSAEFFYLGSSEKDPLKRFLNFFLCVERLVHSCFSSIDQELAVASLLADYPDIEGSGQKLFADHRDSWKDLRNRFIWCVMHKWRHLTDADVEQFERLKSVRDKISHGRLSTPDGADVRDVEGLALRILRSH
jgi:hypothetical protein